MHLNSLSRAALCVAGLAAVAGAQTRTIDGSDNNAGDSTLGSADTALRRATTNDYGDGLSSPSGATRQSARAISNIVCPQSGLMPNSQGATDMVWQWGQFLDHDIDLSAGASPAEPFNIPVPIGDPFFDPFAMGGKVIPLNRTVHETDGMGVRQQVNQITTWIDGSNVYGSDQARADFLRTMDGTGRLKMSAGRLMPYNTGGFANANDTGLPEDELFLGGDVRANEQIGLACMHTLFVREHNFWADLFGVALPGSTGDELYEAARLMVWAELQAITFREFLPTLLGGGVVPSYGGYNANVDPRIENAFSTASYRFGHSMLSPTLARLDSNLNVAPEGNIALRDAFFTPHELEDNGIDSTLRGLSIQLAQEVDTRIISDVRNFLFGPPGAGGFDLASLNIQRGRDHGLPDYNTLRTDYGLAPVANFNQITANAVTRASLEAAYGNVNNIDPWVGGLAEDHVSGGLVGELVQTVLLDQFLRLRAGDAFWYERVLPQSVRRFVNSQTLATIIRRNTEIGGELPRNVFGMNTMGSAQF